MRKSMKKFLRVVERVMKANLNGEHYWFVKSKGLTLTLSQGEGTKAERKTTSEPCQMAERKASPDPGYREYPEDTGAETAKQTVTF